MTATVQRWKNPTKISVTELVGKVRNYRLLAEAIARATLRAAVNGTFSVGTQSGEVMTTFPHGRMAWAIHLRVPERLRDELAASRAKFTPYVDLSVMPRVEASDD